MKNIGRGCLKGCSGDARGCKERDEKIGIKMEKRGGGRKTCIYSYDAHNSSIQSFLMFMQGNYCLEYQDSYMSPLEALKPYFCIFHHPIHHYV